MKNLKTIYVCLFALLFLVTALVFFKIKKQEEFRQKTALAQSIRKSLQFLMTDIREARRDSILNVPADGMWHNSIAFDTLQQGPLEYRINNGHLVRTNHGQRMLIADDIGGMRFRRQKDTPDLLEVQIKSVKNVTLVSNLKIRIH